MPSLPAIPAVRGWFRPERAALDPALGRACEGLRPEAAWRLLHQRDVLPPGWLDEPRRRFPALAHLTTRERAERLRWAPRVPAAAHPDRAIDCVEIAAMTSAMERAETLARAFVLAAAPWGRPQPEVILWVPTRPDAYGDQCHDTKPGVWEPDALAWTVFPHAAAENRWREIDDRLPADIKALTPWALGDEEWLAAVARDARAPGGERFSDLVSPFAAAIGVFACGFGILPSSSEMLVLGYPVPRDREA